MKDLHKKENLEYFMEPFYSNSDKTYNMVNNMSINQSNDLVNNMSNNQSNDLVNNMSNNQSNDLVNNMSNNQSNDLVNNMSNNQSNDLVNNMSNNQSNDLVNNMLSNVKDESSKLTNCYRCEYCNKGVFVHNKYLDKFLDTCCVKFVQDNELFFKRSIAHTLGLYIAINIEMLDKLRSKNFELYGKYKSIIPLGNESKNFICNGMIEHYNDKLIFTQNNIGMDKWLIMNNIRCMLCESITCPFHEKHGSFENHVFCGKKLYCCGWCGDEISRIMNQPCDESTL
jgi:hypothetical protein